MNICTTGGVQTPSFKSETPPYKSENECEYLEYKTVNKNKPKSMYSNCFVIN